MSSPSRGSKPRRRNERSRRLAARGLTPFIAPSAPFAPPDRPKSTERDRPAGSLPCLCRVLAVSLLGDFRRPAGFGAPILAEPPHGECDQPGKREARGEQGGTNHTLGGGWGRPGGFSPQNTRSDFMEPKQRPCHQRIAPRWARREIRGRPSSGALPDLRSSFTVGILPVYSSPTDYPHITRTSPTAGRFPPGGPATRPNGPRGIASTRVWQPPHGRCADDVTQGRVHLLPNIPGLAAPRKGKFGSCVQVVAVIEA